MRGGNELLGAYSLLLFHNLLQKGILCAEECQKIGKTLQQSLKQRPFLRIRSGVSRGKVLVQSRSLELTPPIQKNPWPKITCNSHGTPSAAWHHGCWIVGIRHLLVGHHHPREQGHHTRVQQCKSRDSWNARHSQEGQHCIQLMHQPMVHDGGKHGLTTPMRTQSTVQSRTDMDVSEQDSSGKALR